MTVEGEAVIVESYFKYAQSVSRGKFKNISVRVRRSAFTATVAAFSVGTLVIGAFAVLRSVGGLIAGLFNRFFNTYGFGIAAGCRCRAATCKAGR